MLHVYPIIFTYAYIWAYNINILHFNNNERTAFIFKSVVTENVPY